MNVFNLFKNKDEQEITTLDAKLDTLSDKYKLVPTKLIAEKFKSMGFVTAEYVETRVRKASKQGYQKHMVRMNNPKLLSSAHKDVKLQLVITNSHDGLSSFSIKLGIYRLVCSNGLMVGSTFESVTLRHTGSIIEQVDQAVERMVAQVKKLDEAIAQMKARKLTREEEIEFINKAVKLRYPSGNSQDVQIPALRPEDTGSDVFTVYNRIQESLIRGGNTVRNSRNQRRSARALRSINAVTKINEQLFDMAYELAQVA